MKMLPICHPLPFAGSFLASSGPLVPLRQSVPCCWPHPRGALGEQTRPAVCPMLRAPASSEGSPRLLRTSCGSWRGASFLDLSGI